MAFEDIVEGIDEEGIVTTPDNTKKIKQMNRTVANIISLLSSATNKQSKILSYVMTSEMANIENALTGRQTLTNVYNTAWLVANINMFLKDQYTEQVNSYKETQRTIMNVALNYAKTNELIHPETRELLTQTLIDNGMKYVTALGDDIRTDVTRALSTSLAEGASREETVQAIHEVIGGYKSRASSIARTETSRAFNTMSYAQAKTDGVQFYVVDNRAEACEDCQDEFEGVVFPIDDIGSMPPLHPNCACVPVYFYNEEEAQQWADALQTQDETIRDNLENDGFDINPDGTSNNSNDVEPSMELPDNVDVPETPAPEEQQPEEPTQPTTNEYTAAAATDVGIAYIGADSKPTSDTFNQVTYDNGTDSININIDERNTNIDYSHEDIFNAYSQLPDVFQETIDNVNIVDNNTGILGTDGYFNRLTEDSIYITDEPKGSEVEATLWHEAYHNYEYADSENAAAIANEWDKAMETDNNYVTNYSEESKSSLEDRCESFMLYLKDADSFANDYPARAEVFDKYLGVR